MRSKRSHDKYAPVLTEEKYEPVKRVRKKQLLPFAGPVPFRASRYVESLYQSYFKEWNLKEG